MCAGCHNIFYYRRIRSSFNIQSWDQKVRVAGGGPFSLPFRRISAVDIGSCIGKLVLVPGGRVRDGISGRSARQEMKMTTPERHPRLKAESVNRPFCALTAGRKDLGGGTAAPLGSGGEEASLGRRCVRRTAGEHPSPPSRHRVKQRPVSLPSTLYTPDYLILSHTSSTPRYPRLASRLYKFNYIWSTPSAGTSFSSPTDIRWTEDCISSYTGQCSFWTNSYLLSAIPLSSQSDERLHPTPIGPLSTLGIPTEGTAGGRSCSILSLPRYIILRSFIFIYGYNTLKVGPALRNSPSFIRRQLKRFIFDLYTHSAVPFSQ